jgi:hypothetical protein
MMTSLAINVLAERILEFVLPSGNKAFGCRRYPYCPALVLGYGRQKRETR